VNVADYAGCDATELTAARLAFASPPRCQRVPLHWYGATSGRSACSAASADSEGSGLLAAGFVRAQLAPR